MTRCPAHGSRIQLDSTRAVNQFGAPSTSPACRRTRRPAAGGSSSLGAQHKGGCGDLSRRRKCWGASPLPEASMRHGAIHARSALFWSGFQGKPVAQAGGLGFYCGSAEKSCVLSSLQRFDDTQQGSTPPVMTSVFFADDEVSCFHLARIQPYSVVPRDPGPCSSAHPQSTTSSREAPCLVQLDSR